MAHVQSGDPQIAVKIKWENVMLLTGWGNKKETDKKYTEDLGFHRRVPALGA